MAYVVIQDNKVVGVFAIAQNHPAQEGYQVIPDNDPRLLEFLETKNPPIEE